MIKKYTCIICPNSCKIRAEIEDGEIINIEGNKCKRGLEYVIQEEKDPQRNIASSVKVEHGDLPLASVRLSKAVSKKKIKDIMKEIKGITVEAPLKIGQVLVENIEDTGSDLIVTKNVDRM